MKKFYLLVLTGLFSVPTMASDPSHAEDTAVHSVLLQAPQGLDEPSIAKMDLKPCVVGSGYQGLELQFTFRNKELYNQIVMTKTYRLCPVIDCKADILYFRYKKKLEDSSELAKMITGIFGLTKNAEDRKLLNAMLNRLASEKRKLTKEQAENADRVKQLESVNRSIIGVKKSDAILENPVAAVSKPAITEEAYYKQAQEYGMLPEEAKKYYSMARNHVSWRQDREHPDSHYDRDLKKAKCGGELIDILTLEVPYSYDAESGRENIIHKLPKAMLKWLKEHYSKAE